MNRRTFSIVLVDTEVAHAFSRMLPKNFLVEELNGNEKYCYFDCRLPSSSARIGMIKVGDIMFCNDSCITVFYESFDTSYGYEPIGRIMDTQSLSDAFGPGDVAVRFS